MKKIACLVVCFSLLLCSLVCFVGCGSSNDFAFAQGGAGVIGDSALMGRWVGDGQDSDFPRNMDLLKNGTGISYDSSATGAGAGFNWSTENGRFYTIVSGGRSNVWVYKISGGTLTLTSPDGKYSATYKKQ
jgi:hypothetical protein